ncbi:TlpA disulfide reductase family protein [uncultured Pontibacter sp.]|uniref:TlpA family protein disulfide reductase n=1 Tax=uncultured Pontibacter sp. TaxID=453356 RepID=UPI00261BF618|nr:TlpA disulfide reductase family protein [uncultured Pontibacter sp.]
MYITLLLSPTIPVVDSGNPTSAVDEEEDFVRKYKNKSLPTFSLKALDGTIVDNKMLEGKVVMINFWSTTCGPCIMEMPDLNRLKELHPDVLFLAIAPENDAKINSLLAKHPFDFLILPDGTDLFKEWGITSYPRNFFIDRSGKIRDVKQGTPVATNYDTYEITVRVVELYSPILKRLERKKR